MDATLIAAHKNIEKLMPFLHLPVQSGSDTVLKAMNRKHEVSFYLDIIGRLGQARKDIAFSSDFIVGFPGETDRDFSQTLQLIDTVKFAQAYSFKYSLRPGTPGALREDQIPENIKDERLQQVQQRLKHHQRAFNQQMLGKTVPVLFEMDSGWDALLLCNLFTSGQGLTLWEKFWMLALAKPQEVL